MKMEKCSLNTAKYTKYMTKEEIAKQYPLTPSDMYAPPIAQLDLNGQHMMKVYPDTMGGWIWLIRDKAFQQEFIKDVIAKHGIHRAIDFFNQPESSLAHTIGSIVTWADTPRGHKGYQDIQRAANNQSNKNNRIADKDKVYWEWNEMMDIAYKEQLEEKEKKKKISEMPIEKKQAIADKINDLLNNI